jgi:hypothetical protein
LFRIRIFISLEFTRVAFKWNLVVDGTRISNQVASSLEVHLILWSASVWNSITWIKFLFWCLTCLIILKVWSQIARRGSFSPKWPNKKGNWKSNPTAVITSLTPNIALRSGSLNRNGMFDTCKRFGLLMDGFLVLSWWWFTLATDWGTMIQGLAFTEATSAPWLLLSACKWHRNKLRHRFLF